MYSLTFECFRVVFCEVLRFPHELENFLIILTILKMSAQKGKFCRFCAEIKSDADLIDSTINSPVFKEIKGKLTFLKIKGISFSNKDHLPKNVCLQCNDSLNDAHEFISKIKQSQARLKKLKVKNIYSPDNQISDIVKNEDHLDAEFEPDNPILDSYFSNSSDEENETKECLKKEFSEQHHEIDIKEEEIELIGKSWAGYIWGCQHCDEVFATMDVLREHSLNTHELCCALKCADCAENFCEFGEFVDHVRMHREALRQYCEFCNLKLESENESQHISEHREKSFICFKCGQVFDNKNSLTEHINKDNRLKRKLSAGRKTTVRTKKRKRLVKLKDESWNGYPWMCQLCEAKFDDVSSLRTHVKEIHQKCFAMKCIDCDERMDSYRLFVSHVRKHRKYLKQICQYCNHKLGVGQSRTEHIATHFTESTRLCEGCGELFPNVESYKRHIATYNPPTLKEKRWARIERPYCIDDIQCDICQKVFRNPYRLREHKNRHNADREKKYTCEQCGKAFYSDSALQYHQMIHDKSKTVICEICQKGFTHLSDLRQHVTTHTGEKPFQCEVCQRRFRLNKQMVSHMRMHTNERPYKCEYCEKTFRHRNVLKEHENQHTGARPYRCKECGVGYGSWKGCEKHMKSKHGITSAKNVWTPQGKVPVDPKTGKPKEIRNVEEFKEWTEQLLAKRRPKEIDGTGGKQ